MAAGGVDIVGGEGQRGDERQRVDQLSAIGGVQRLRGRSTVALGEG
jgi:hypothetical protein